MPKFVGYKIGDMRSRLRFLISGVLVVTSRNMHVEISIDFEPRQANHSQYSLHV